MTGSAWFLMIVVCLCVGTVGYVVYYPRVEESGDSKKWLRMLFAVAFFWGIAACFAPLVYEFRVARKCGSHVFSIKSDGSYVEHPNGCWEWVEGEIYCVNSTTTMFSEAVLDKADPGSRKTRYILIAEVYDPVLYVKNMDEKIGGYEICHFFADQFNLLGDPVFAQCLDSKDVAQQARLTELAKSWFDPRLQRYGMRVKEARFR